MDKKVSLIMASMIDGGIGCDNQLPWYVPSELKKFRRITTKCKDPDKINAVIMGRQTWEALGSPLKNRLNIVITRNVYYQASAYGDNDNVVVLHSIISAFIYCDKPYIENIFIIGGAEMYNKFLTSNSYYKKIERIYLTIMFYDNHKNNADKFMEIGSIFENFRIKKDPDYKTESDDRKFASYICTPNKKTIVCLDKTYIG